MGYLKQSRQGQSVPSGAENEALPRRPRWQAWWIDLILVLLLATYAIGVIPFEDLWALATIALVLFFLGYVLIRPRLALDFHAKPSPLNPLGCAIVVTGIVVASYVSVEFTWLLAVACPVVWIASRTLKAGIIWNTVMIVAMGFARFIADIQVGRVDERWLSEVLNVVLPLAFTIMIGSMVHAALRWGAERAELLEEIQASSHDLAESYRHLMIATEAIPAQDSPLSARETEVLTLVAEGMTNRQIGERLFISTATVKTHMEHILAKMGATTRTQAVLAAHQEGLLT